MLAELEGDQIYSDWGRVMLIVAPDVESEAYVQFPLDCEFGISGPQSGERLKRQ